MGNEELILLINGLMVYGFVICLAVHLSIQQEQVESDVVILVTFNVFKSGL